MNALFTIILTLTIRFLIIFFLYNYFAPMFNLPILTGWQLFGFWILIRQFFPNPIK